MKLKTLSRLAVLTLLPAAALAAQDPNAKLFDKIHHVNQKEIALAQLALQKSQSADVKQFAQEMINDHTAADQKVTDLAKSKNIELAPFQLAGYEKADQDKLSQLDGSNFDQAYAKEMKKGHEQVLHELKEARKQTKDPETAALLDQLIPTVRTHEKNADHLKSEVKS